MQKEDFDKHGGIVLEQLNYLDFVFHLVANIVVLYLIHLMPCAQQCLKQKQYLNQLMKLKNKKKKIFKKMQITCDIR